LKVPNQKKPAGCSGAVTIKKDEEKLNE